MLTSLMEHLPMHTGNRHKKITYGRRARNADLSSFSDQDGQFESANSESKSTDDVNNGTLGTSLAPSLFDVPSESEDDLDNPRAPIRSSTHDPKQRTPQPSIFDIESSESERPSRLNRTPMKRPRGSHSAAFSCRDSQKTPRSKHLLQTQTQEDGIPSSSAPPTKRIRTGYNTDNENEMEIMDIYDPLSIEPIVQTNMRALTTRSVQSPPKTPRRNRSTNTFSSERSSSTEVNPSWILHAPSTPISQSRGLASVTPKARRKIARESSSPSPDEGTSPSKKLQRKSRSAVTTPRQAKAWAGLLNEDLAATPVRPMNALSLEQTNKGQSMRPITSTALSSRSNSRRRRLIDELEGTQEEKSSSPEESVTGSEADDPLHVYAANQPQSATLGIGQPALESVLLQRSAMANGVKRTYAGERTYRTEEGDLVDQLLSQPLDDYDDPASSAKLGSSIDDSDNEENGGDVRNIHELRAAGDSQKFEDAMSILISDLELMGPSSLSTKRATLLDLCKMLDNTDCLNRFTGHGHELRVLRLCAREMDSIFGSLAAVIVHLLLQGPQNVRSSIQILESGILGALVPLLSLNRGVETIAKERRSNMSKVSQASLLEFQQHVLDANILRAHSSPKSLTPQLLALSAMSQTFTMLRRAGIPNALLSLSALNQLITVLKSADTDHPSGIVPSIQQEFALAILSASTVATACVQDKSLWSESRLRDLTELLEHFLENTQDDLEQRCLRFVLQIYTNLANNNASYSDIIGSESVVHRLVSLIKIEFKRLEDTAMETLASVTQDTLSLSLGAMINLAEWSDRVRSQFDYSQKLLLEPLVKFFVDSRAKVADADTLQASQANVMYGLLAVLLGNLCKNNKVSDRVRKHLKGGNLELVVNAIEEFIGHNEAVDQGEANASYTAFTTHLQSVLDNLRKVDAKDGKTRG